MQMRCKWKLKLKSNMIVHFENHILSEIDRADQMMSYYPKPMYENINILEFYRRICVLH